MALVELAQAVTGEVHIPWRPKAIAICPADILAIIIGMKNGDIFSKFPFSCPFMVSFSMVSIPPIPLENTTPNLVLSTFSRSIPLSAIASFAATMAN